jgi:hypothetical protein
MINYRKGIVAAMAAVSIIVGATSAQANSHGRSTASLAGIAKALASQGGATTQSHGPGGNVGGHAFTPRMTPLSCDFDDTGFDASAFYTTENFYPIFNVQSLNTSSNDDFAGAIIDGVSGYTFNSFSWQPKLGSPVTNGGPAVILIGVDSINKPVIGISFLGDGSGTGPLDRRFKSIPVGYYQENFFPTDFQYLTGTPTGAITLVTLAFGTDGQGVAQLNKFADIKVNNSSSARNLNPIPCPFSNGVPGF